MSMKYILIAAVFIGFIGGFRVNPLGTTIVGGVLLLGYMWYKSKKRGRTGKSGSLFGGRGGNQQADPIQQVITYYTFAQLTEIIWQLKNDNSQGNLRRNFEHVDEEEKLDQHEKAKQEILELL